MEPQRKVNQSGCNHLKNDVVGNVGNEVKMNRGLILESQVTYKLLETCRFNFNERLLFNRSNDCILK